MEFSINNNGYKQLVIKNDTITQLPNIKGIEVLIIENCTSLTSIPNIEGLKVLDCTNCTSLTSIPNILGLRELRCCDCTSLTSIPNILGLEELDCSGCTSLTSIANIEGLERLDCDRCTWINPDQTRIERLIRLQNWFKRYQLRIKINKFIPLFTEYWFSPDGPGGRFIIQRGKRNFNKNKRKLEVGENESCKKQKIINL